jgi:hypothetical protein
MGGMGDMDAMDAMGGAGGMGRRGLEDRDVKEHRSDRDYGADGAAGAAGFDGFDGFSNGGGGGVDGGGSGGGGGGGFDDFDGSMIHADMSHMTTDSTIGNNMSGLGGDDSDNSDDRDNRDYRGDRDDRGDRGDRDDIRHEVGMMGYTAKYTAKYTVTDTTTGTGTGIDTTADLHSTTDSMEGGEQERWRRRAGIPVLYNQPPRDLVAPPRGGNSAQHSSLATVGRLPESMKPPSSAKASLRARAPFASQLQRHHYERSVTPGVVDYRTQPGEYGEESNNYRGPRMLSINCIGSSRVSTAKSLITMRLVLTKFYPYYSVYW